MARKKKHEEHENHERWLVSYADFITLLFAFFVVMYAVSSVNAGKYRVLSDSLIAAFNEPKKSFEPIQIGEIIRSNTDSTIEMISKPTLVKVPVISLNNQESQSGKMPGAGLTSSPENASDIKKIADEVAQAMQKLVDAGLVTITATDLWVEVDIRDSVLFPSGSAQIRQEAIEVLTRVAGILADFTNPVRIEGFTDNVPISTAVYPSNWELSSARAASVVRLFERLHIDSTRLSAVGYGEYRPVAGNDTEEGRAKNRRVVLVALADHQVEQLLDERLRAAGAAQPVVPVAAAVNEATAPSVRPPEQLVATAPADVTATPADAASAVVMPPSTPAPSVKAPVVPRKATTAVAAPMPPGGRPPNPRPRSPISMPAKPLELAPPVARPGFGPALPLVLPADIAPAVPPAGQAAP